MALRWKKLGMIFRAEPGCLPPKCTSFAQSPQALVFPDYVRIYFSTRSWDAASGKYLSHVAFADMDRFLRRVHRVSQHTVLPLGGRGCFDEHGVFPLSPLRHDGEILGFTCGWSRRVSVPVETAIGRVRSEDKGWTFQRYGEGPVLAASQQEPVLVGDPFVRHHDGCFHMWYIFGTRWLSAVGTEPPARIYRIAYARSNDGIQWERDEGVQIIPDRLGSDECQALPSVIRAGDRFHMVFCYRYATDFRTNAERGYRLGYATSADLVTWNRDDDALGLSREEGAWDTSMMCYPHLFHCDDRVYLLYNGNEFGRYGFGAAELHS